MNLLVTSVRALAQDIKAFGLRAGDGGALPAPTPGAHIQVVIPGLDGGTATRAYSIVSDPTDEFMYEIAVLRVESCGGSAFMHQLRVGDTIEVSAPRDEFPLDRHAPNSILIAGGIGITPILPHLRALSAQHRSYELHYIARDRERLVYRDEIVALAGERARFYVSEPEFDLRRILVSGGSGAHVYACGPYGLIDAVRSIALEAGFSRSSIHFESFGYRRDSGHRRAEIELRNSGIKVQADPGKSLLEAIEASGVWIPSECRRGDCATCATTVVQGEVAHRDHCLTTEQRAHLICPCVSWPKGDRLVLEI